MTVTIALGPAAGAAAWGAGAVSAGASGAFSAGLLQAALSAMDGISHQLGTRRMGMLLGGLGTVSRGGVEARVQHLGMQPAGVEGSPRLGAGQPDLRRAKQKGVDLVEVPLVPLEDVVERRAVIPRGGCRHLFGQLGQLLVAGANGVVCLAAVEDAVVGAADAA